MTPEDDVGGMAPIAEATAELRGLGHEPAVIGRLLLNGAAVVLHRACSEAEFLDFAQQMWRAKERQVALCGLLDRVKVSSEYRFRFRGKRKRSELSEASGVRGETP